MASVESGIGVGACQRSSLPDKREAAHVDPEGWGRDSGGIIPSLRCTGILCLQGFL